MTKHTLYPHQRQRVEAAIADHCRNNHKASAATTWLHMKWSFQEDMYWLHKMEIKQLVTNHFKHLS